MRRALCLPICGLMIVLGLLIAIAAEAIWALRLAQSLLEGE